MANSIVTADKYVQKLDSKLKDGALTGRLEADQSFVRDFDGAGKIKILNMDLNGLADYDRTTGFVAGDITTTWQEHVIANDRGRSFQLDSQDENESARLNDFVSISKEFVEQHVIPEVDAVRFAKLNTLGTSIAEDLATGNEYLTAIDAGLEAMRNAEVSMDGMVLYVSAEGYTLLKNADKITREFSVQGGAETIQRNFWSLDGMEVVVVPNTRFNTAVTLTGDGFTLSGNDLNFVIVQPAYVQAITKHAKIREFSPDVNQVADAWKYDYRIYHDLIIPDNKVAGVYASAKTA